MISNNDMNTQKVVNEFILFLKGESDVQYGSVCIGGMRIYTEYYVELAIDSMVRRAAKSEIIRGLKELFGLFLYKLRRTVPPISAVSLKVKDSDIDELFDTEGFLRPILDYCYRSV